ncbi:hypothetical protein IKR55_00175 [bacterium]|nr:hypothetical protein [bacterium]
MANLFGMGGGTNIYLTVSQSCGLEMIELGKDGSIKSYAQAPLTYNEGQREIADYEEFRAALEEVFSKRNVSPAQANIHLSIPTVWFGSKEGIPLLLDDNGIGTIVLGELEQSFLFKRKDQDPIPFWFDNRVAKSSDSRSIFFTAIQASAVAQIKAVLTAMGANLVSIECSLFASLRGLHQIGVATQQMETDAAWSLMIVTNSGFQLVDMQGKKIAGYYEEPIPFKNYEGEEIYSAIDNAAQIAFMSSSSSSLVIVSETDLVSAQVLSEKMQFGGQVVFVEDNKFRMEPLLTSNLNILAEDQLKVSLHAIGHVVPANSIGMPVDVNFLGDQAKPIEPVATIETPFGEMTPQKAAVIVAIIGALILVPLFLANFFLKGMVTKAREESSALDNRISQLDAELAKYDGGATNKEFNAVNEIEKVLKNNRTKIMAYAALGESIPKNVYLTYFLTGDDSKISIIGCADAVEDVYVFFKNLKDSLVDSGLRISKLDLKEGSLDKVVNSTSSTIDDAPYVFEITNMTEQELTEFEESLASREEVKADSEETTEEEQQQ